jgi:hypothetical protein
VTNYMTKKKKERKKIEKFRGEKNKAFLHCIPCFTRRFARQHYLSCYLHGVNGEIVPAFMGVKFGITLALYSGYPYSDLKPRHR